jgi:hypothetical protein
MLCHLGHQVSLVFCGELASAFLVPALELVHFYTPSIRHPMATAVIAVTSYPSSVRMAGVLGSVPRPCSRVCDGSAVVKPLIKGAARAATGSNGHDASIT